MWLLWLFLLTSPVVIGIGFREFLTKRRLLRAGTRVEGLVVRHRTAYSQGKPTHFAVINFQDARGNRHEFEAGLSGVRGLPVGGRAAVLHLPDDPRSARLDLSSKRRGALLLIFGIGLAWLVIPGCLLVAAG